MTIETVEVKFEGVTLANAIWRQFRRQPVGFIEKVMALNPGISSHIELPVGTKIKFPLEDAVNPATANRTVIRLWN